MRRLVLFAAAVAAAAPAARAWAADPQADPTPQPAHYLSWPGKSGAPSQAAAKPPATASHVDLGRQFFGQGDDMAAPPAPLAPRDVPGTQAATSTSNTASNRARQNEILTSDSASDGPAGGAGGSPF